MVAVALVIPAWNEPQAIRALLPEVPAGSVGRVYVVVPSPTDASLAAARDCGADVVIQSQPGYGAACWSGAQAALADGAEIIAFLDGDYSDPPRALPSVLQPILDGSAEVVLGCRRHQAQALPAHARLGNWLVRRAISTVVGHRFPDLPSFKAIRADALRQLDMCEMTYGWTVEMLVKAARSDLRIAEVWVDYRPRLGGTSKVAGSLRGSLGAARKLFGCTLVYSAWRPMPMTSGQ